MYVPPTLQKQDLHPSYIIKNTFISMIKMGTQRQNGVSRKEILREHVANKALSQANVFVLPHDQESPFT